MKRYFLMLACAALAFASCDETKNSGTPDLGGNDPEDIVTPGKTPTASLTPDAQKTKIASVGEEILELCPSNDFEHLAQIGENFSQFFEDADYYDLSELEEWYYGEIEGAYNDSYNQSVKGSTVTNTYKTAIIFYLANHTGLFTFGEDKVTVSNYKGTKAVFNLNDNNYEAEITTSGKVTDALFVSKFYQTEKDCYEYYNEKTGEWVETSNPVDLIYNSETKVTVGVPEKVIIDLKENGSSLAKITVEFKTAFSKEGYKLTTDAFAVSYKAEINGYEIAVNNASYNGTTGNAEASCSLKKDGITIFKTFAAANVKIAMNEKVYSDEYYEHSYTEVEVTKADKISCGLDIMGQIQAVGTFTDVMKAQTLLDNLWEALDEGNEASANNYIEEFNNMLNFGIYYDNGSNKQADIEFETVAYDDYYDTYYDMVPVLVFNDDARYAIEDFFTESAFGTLVDNFYALVDSYSEVFAYFMPQDSELEPGYGGGEYYY
ncbi:MAG: hypothetical protein IJ005_07425 [Bacteroidales bacterium]|nr:hypothetical protein [Bacteroidales bacterium]